MELARCSECKKFGDECLPELDEIEDVAITGSCPNGFEQKEEQGKPQPDTGELK